MAAVRTFHKKSHAAKSRGAVADGGLDPSAERDDLLETIRDLEFAAECADDAEGCLHDLRDDADAACKLIRRAMSNDEREFSVNELLQQALEKLE
ncbi:hypothetical protein NL64_09070 [Pseudomonas fluorescens]|nr:hypothetical protein NL64_09070 [Pseudomonas fluorescens]